MIVYIYHSPNCPKCKLTKRVLEKNGVKVKTVLVEESSPLINKFRKLGYKSFPVVQVKDTDGNLVTEWTDFRKDKITEVIKEKETF